MQIELKDGTVQQASVAFKYKYNELIARRDLTQDNYNSSKSKVENLIKTGGTISEFFWFEIHKAAMANYQGMLVELYDELLELFKQHDAVRVIKD